MIPERLDFLDRFDKSYQILVNSLKEDEISERDFYTLIITKARAMDQERKEVKRSRRVKK